MIKKSILVLGFFFSVANIMFPQSETLVLDLDLAIEMANRHHYSIRVAEAGVKLAGEERNIILPPVNILIQKGQLYSSANDYNIEIIQDFSSLNSYFSRKKTVEIKAEQKQLLLNLSYNELERDVKKNWHKLIYLNETYAMGSRLLYYYSERLRIAELQVKAGEISEVEVVNIKMAAAEAESKLYDIQAETDRLKRNLRYLISYDNEIQIPDRPLEMYSIEFATAGLKNFSGDNLHSDLYQLQADLTDINVSMAKTSIFPGVSAGYFQRSIAGRSGMKGLQVNLTVPIWLLAGNQDVSRSKILSEIAHYELESKREEQEKIIGDLVYRLDQLFGKIMFYNEDALMSVDMVEQTVLLQSEREDIEFEELLRTMVKVSDIRQSYFDTIDEYNQTAIQLEYYVK